MGRKAVSIKHLPVDNSKLSPSTGAAWMKNQSDEDKCIAFCHNPLHLGKLSENLLKSHQCLEKQCKYLHKYEQKGYWIRKKLINALKKKKKNGGRGCIIINQDKYLTSNLDRLYKVAMKEVELTGDQPPYIQYREYP